MTNILYVTDLHGHTEVYEQAFAEAAKKEIAALILGGDLCPTGFHPAFIPVQREYLASYLIPRIEKFTKDTGKAVFMMMGNDDFRTNEQLLAAAEKNRILKLTNGRVHQLGEWTILGYSFINESPFLMKEWEKTEKEIEHDLLTLAAGQDMARTIVHLHAPPKNTALDMLYDSTHVGSTGIRAFIEKKQPALTLHGHIHESPEISESFVDRIGRTVCVNPGNGNLAVIDLADIHKIAGKKK